jgi:hypothetical protein
MDSLVRSVTAQLLDLPAPALAFDVPSFGHRRRSGRPAFLRFRQRRRNDRSKAFRHHLAMAQLTALQLRGAMQHALLIDRVLEFRQQALTLLLGLVQMLYLIDLQSASSPIG